MSNAQTIQKILAAVERGGSAAEYLGKAFISFYHGGKNTVDLRESRVLDNGNLQLFFEMLSLRRRENWSDDELFEAAKKVKALLKATA